MEKFKEFIKRHLFFEGVAFGVLMCVWTYGTFIKEGYEQVKIKKDLLEEECAKNEGFQDKFYQAQIENHSLSAKIEDVQLQLSDEQKKFADLRDSRWEEKYNSERLARISAEEQLASATGRLTGMISVRDQNEKDFETIKEKLLATERERDSLKLLYQGQPEKPVKTSNVAPEVRPSNSSANNLLAALDGMQMLDVGDFIISSAPKIDGGIPPDVFIGMLDKADILSRARVVSAVGKYVQRPISPEQISKISGMLDLINSASAMQSLVAP
jgi:hypothetical protein